MVVPCYTDSKGPAQRNWHRQYPQVDKIFEQQLIKTNTALEPCNSVFVPMEGVHWDRCYIFIYASTWKVMSCIKKSEQLRRWSLSIDNTSKQICYQPLWPPSEGKGQVQGPILVPWKAHAHYPDSWPLQSFRYFERFSHKSTKFSKKTRFWLEGHFVTE